MKKRKMTAKYAKIEEVKVSDIQKAEDLLRLIAEAKSELAKVEAEALREIEAVKAAYAEQIKGINDFLHDFNECLVYLMKTNKAEWFSATDQVDLEHGILLYGRELKVIIPRDALARIEDLGWSEAVKIAKSVDRGVVETWPLERLVRIGADRKEKETFSYELKVKNKGNSEKDGNQQRREPS